MITLTTFTFYIHNCLWIWLAHFFFSISRHLALNRYYCWPLQFWPRCIRCDEEKPNAWMLLLVIGQYIHTRHTNIHILHIQYVQLMLCMQQFGKEQRCAWSKLFIPVARDIIFIRTVRLVHHTTPSSDSCILDSNYSSEIAVQVISRKKSESNRKKERKEDRREEEERKKKTEEI